MQVCSIFLLTLTGRTDGKKWSNLEHFSGQKQPQLDTDTLTTLQNWPEMTSNLPLSIYINSHAHSQNNATADTFNQGLPLTVATLGHKTFLGQGQGPTKSG